MATYKVEIWVSFWFENNEWLAFSRIFEFPFVPFYGLSIEYDEENQYSVELLQNELIKTNIKYHVETKDFYVEVGYKIRGAISESNLDDIFREYASWKREDNTIFVKS